MVRLDVSSQCVMYVVVVRGCAGADGSDRAGAAPGGTRKMNARTQSFRLQAISLAIVLAIIDQTQGFTLRYEYVRPHDLTAEESRYSEVRHELKRDIEENEEFQVAPIAVALPLTMTTESIAETTLNNDIGSAGNTVKHRTSVQEETPLNPNEQGESESNAPETMNSTANYAEVKTFPIEQQVSTDTTTLPHEGTIITTTLGVTDNYIEASANEEKKNSTVIEKKTSSIAFNSTSTSPIVRETVTVPLSATEITTEIKPNATETTPAWKKYTKIERKPMKVNDEVVPLQNQRVSDSINSHTIESRVSLEKAFDLAPDILSLQELKTHLLESTNSVPTTILLPTEVNPIEMVSKRAGYLDHTKPIIDAMISTTVNASRASNEVEIDGVAYEMDAHYDNEDTQNKTSHSQMVEDALREEFLAEAHLDDNTLFTTTPKYNRANVELNEITPSPQDDQQPTEDHLTVKPINISDKKSILYTVSPNYKPLKKIEVQPMKPFVRDPDDNSWRNESLSSLGIVFKGKNSTKAFTEVLKNKTETVMGNLTEPEKVLEKVDLRDRLEKIAEKRKSRKKKIDKDGNAEYTDYEENSSSDMHSSKEKPDANLTTLPTPPGLITTGISLESILKITPATDSSKKPKTNKPKFSFTDYYDGKDDDADYATYPNIDILKSTPRPRVQWPVTQKILDNTQPIRPRLPEKQNRQSTVHTVGPYLPDRQPTVQYFPPIPKKISDNSKDYRDDFKHKFTLFGHTAQPENEPIETYTEKNIPNKYVTADRSRVSNENINGPIQHVEYRPVGATDDGFVIRHYKDLLESVAKDMDYDRNGPYQRPAMSDEGKSVKSEEYDYGQRKEGLNKFVDYFNQNHERFKADFPVIFNTSIVHGAESGKVLASSSAMFKRLYNGAQAQTQREAFAFSNKPFDPNCENITVELSPAYELHYYVPEQEETATDHTMPYGYRTV